MILPANLKLRACLWATLFPLVLAAFAQASLSFIPPVPTNIDAVEIYLLTRGAGAEVYTKYGHTMLRVVDPSNSLDVAYNWGAFNFGEPGFIGKFLRGFLRYHLDISPADFEVRISEIEQRWLVQERFNLTRRQKALFLAELNREAQPDRRYYRYLFFTDNCSTRPRDVIDKALGGKLAASFQGRGGSVTFRDKVMEYNASVPILAMGQDVILSSEVDRSISQWEEMFVPLKLREYLLLLPAYNDDGSERTGVKLLSDETILASFPDPVNPPYNGCMIFLVLLGSPLLLGMFLYLTPINGMSALTNLRKISLQKTGLRIIGLALTIWGAVSGIFGLYLALAWAFSEHTVVHHNANLAIFWPLDWYVLFLGLLLLKRGAPLRRGSLLVKFTVWFALGHLASLSIYCLLAISGFFVQDVARVLPCFGLLALLLYGLALYISGFKQHGEERTAARKSFS